MEEARERVAAGERVDTPASRNDGNEQLNRPNLGTTT